MPDFQSVNVGSIPAGRTFGENPIWLYSLSGLGRQILTLEIQVRVLVEPNAFCQMRSFFSVRERRDVWRSGKSHFSYSFNAILSEERVVGSIPTTSTFLFATIVSNKTHKNTNKI
jgi:hypothetical protein